MCLASVTAPSTKFRRPDKNDTWVPRPQLLARLDEDAARPLTLLSAPRGFGKTALICQWLARRAKPSAWLSLDERDNDLSEFLYGLAVAVRTCPPAACSALERLMLAPQLPDVSVLADALAGDLASVSDELILVLDDYHMIHSSEVHHIVRRLLRQRLPGLHMVIITRFDPPLPLGAMRAEELVHEVRSADLRFSLEETDRFLRRAIGSRLDGAKTQLLRDVTEGRIVDLQLQARHGLAAQNVAHVRLR